MYTTPVLIGRSPCLDQAIQTRKFNSLIKIKLGTLPCCCYFIKQLLDGFPCLDGLIQQLETLLELRKSCKLTRLWLVFRALFLTRATYPRVWIRPSKHGNHEIT